MTQAGHFTFDNPDNFRLMREVFEKAGYTDTGVLDRINLKDFPSMRGSDLSLLMRRTAGGSPLDTLIRLFLIEVSCPVEAVQLAVKPMSIESWAGAGIVRIDGSDVEAAVRVLPHQDLLVAFDLPRMLMTEFKENYVMGIGGSTLTLSNLTVRRQSGRTLDLGSGCGIHAFLAARHSDHVFAVDLNPRAVQLAEFNAKLNGLTNVECCEGNLFEPVQNRKFDLVVSNPPFVISPENRYIYRDGGMEADQITRKIVGQVPEFLNEGGYCQILCNWTESPGPNWAERLHEWFAGTGSDVWVLRSETLDAETYATTWIRHTERDDAEHFPERFEQWMDYYDKHTITSIGAGLITLRRMSGRSNWFRADDAPKQLQGPCGEYIERGFALQDFLQTVKDDAMLLNTPFKISPDTRLERKAKPTAEGWADESVQLYLSKGITYSGNIDSYIANLLIQCDGLRKLSDLMNEMAKSLQAEPDKIKSSFCGIVRNLVERGFLLPPE